MKDLDGSLPQSPCPGLWLTFGGTPGRVWSLFAHSWGHAVRIQAHPRLEGEARAPSSSTLGKAPKDPSHTAILGVCEASGRGKHPEQRRSPSAPCSRAQSWGKLPCTTPWTPPSSSRPGPGEHPLLTAAATGRGVPLGRVCIPGRPYCSARGG